MHDEKDTKSTLQSGFYHDYKSYGKTQVNESRYSPGCMAMQTICMHFYAVVMGITLSGCLAPNASGVPGMA